MVRDRGARAGAQGCLRAQLGGSLAVAWFGQAGQRAALTSMRID
jgi:hypothetical protein